MVATAAGAAERGECLAEAVADDLEALAQLRSRVDQAAEGDVRALVCERPRRWWPAATPRPTASSSSRARSTPSPTTRLQADQRRGFDRGQARFRAGDGARRASDRPQRPCSRIRRFALTPAAQRRRLSRWMGSICSASVRARRSPPATSPATLYPSLAAEKLPSERAAALAERAGNDSVAHAGDARPARAVLAQARRSPARRSRVVRCAGGGRDRSRPRSAPPAFRCARLAGRVRPDRRRSGADRARPPRAVVDPAAAHRAWPPSIGALLAVAGTLMQGLFRNPLADPALVGVSSGGALAAASTIVVGDRLLAGSGIELPFERCRSPLSSARWSPRRCSIASRHARAAPRLRSSCSAASPSRRWRTPASACWCSSPTTGSCATSRSGCSARWAAPPGARLRRSRRSWLLARGAAVHRARARSAGARRSRSLPHGHRGRAAQAHRDRAGRGR